MEHKDLSVSSSDSDNNYKFFKVNESRVISDDSVRKRNSNIMNYSKQSRVSSNYNQTSIKSEK